MHFPRVSRTLPLQPAPLDDAPQSYVVLSRVDDPLARARLQRSVIEAYPNVSTLDLANLPRNEAGGVDFAQDFFGKESYLTVSGQLGPGPTAMYSVCHIVDMVGKCIGVR